MIVYTCPEHGIIYACIIKMSSCGHEDYDDMELNWCPSCGRRLETKQQELTEVKQQ